MAPSERGGATLSRSQALHNSQSAPSLSFNTNGKAGITGKTLRNRGEHDVGTVLGYSGDEVYIPRAFWTETKDSPMKQKANVYDPRSFYAEEVGRKSQKEVMKKYLQQEMGKQMKDTSAVKDQAMQEKKDYSQSLSKEEAKLQRQQDQKSQDAKNNKMAFRAGLSEQVAHLDRRAQDARMQQLHDGADVKANTMRQLCQELSQHANRKSALKQDASDMMRQIEEKVASKTDNRSSELAQLKETIHKVQLQDEYRHAAQQDRLRRAQAAQDSASAGYNATAGKELEMRLTNESNRQETDEQRHNLRLDILYGRREAGRERQRQRMCETLKMQVGAKEGHEKLAKMQGQKDRDAIDKSAMMAIEQDLAKSQNQRSQELVIQLDQVKQMAAKQEQLRREGVRVGTCVDTMRVDKAFVDMTIARTSAAQLPKSNDLIHQLDASKHLVKPLGRTEVKPWVDFTKSHFGGVVGVFAGEGSLGPKLAATGGRDRVLTKTVDLAMKDHHMQATWSEGLSKADLEKGFKAAKQRAKTAAVAKSWTSSTPGI